MLKKAVRFIGSSLCWLHERNKVFQSTNPSFEQKLIIILSNRKEKPMKSRITSQAHPINRKKTKKKKIEIQREKKKNYIDFCGFERKFHD